jgi:hypothetical protein
MRFRLAFDRHGQMRVIEALMASLLIVFAVVFVDLFAVTPASPKYESGELEKIGFNVLHDLDEQELLGRFIGNGEWANMTSALAASLPTDVYFNLTVYDMAGIVVNSVPIGYGTSRVFSNSTYVASVTYVVPGYQMLYRPRVLVLQLVRG